MPYKPAPHRPHPPTPRDLKAEGYTHQWRTLSQRTIAAQPWCVRCYATSDLTVDHIQPKSRGGTNDPSNLQVLCRRCNSRKARRPA